jgi:hypothetical protein
MEWRMLPFGQTEVMAWNIRTSQLKMCSIIKSGRRGANSLSWKNKKEHKYLNLTFARLPGVHMSSMHCTRRVGWNVFFYVLPGSSWSNSLEYFDTKSPRSVSPQVPVPWISMDTNGHMGLDPDL